MQKFENLSEIFTIHGVNHIFNSNHHKIGRLFWAFAVLLSFCGFFFYLNNSWIKLMYEPEVLIKTRERNAADFPFPAITICPNVFSSSESAILYDINNTEKKFTDEYCKILLANVLWLIPNVLKFVISHVCPNIKHLDFNIVQTIFNSSIASEELFDFDEFLSQTTAFSGFGPCYTLNGLSYSQLFNTEIIHEDFKQFIKFFIDSQSGSEYVRTNYEDNSTWSPEMGLKTGNILNLKSDLRQLSSDQLNIFLTLTPNETLNLDRDAHFKLFIHKPNEIVTNLFVDYAMNFNESRRFRLKVKSRKTDDALRQFSPESRKCYFENENPLKFFKSYTKLNCEWECRTNAVLRECGCVWYNMVRDNQTKVCSFYETVDCKPNKTECNCYPPCNDLTFELTSEVLKLSMRLQTGTAWNGDFLVENLVEEIETFSSYKTENFIAEFGGFLGLFMGCSLLSIVEFLFFFSLAIRSIFIKIGHKINKSEPMELPSSAIQVISGNSRDISNTILDKLDIIERTVEQIQRQHQEANKKNNANFAKIETRFQKLEKKVTENLIF